MLIGAILAVPAFAAESYVMTHAQFMEGLPLSSVFTGDFIVKVYDSNGLFWASPVFTVYDSFGQEKCFGFDGAGPSGEYVSICSIFEPLEGGVLFHLYIDSESDDFSFYDLMFSYYELVPVEAGSDAEVSPIGSVFDVFGGVGSWIGSQLGSTTSLFWNASTGSLTFLGVLSLCAVGFALILLLVLVVSRFLRFGG